MVILRKTAKISKRYHNYSNVWTNCRNTLALVGSYCACCFFLPGAVLLDCSVLVFMFLPPPPPPPPPLPMLPPLPPVPLAPPPPPSLLLVRPLGILMFRTDSRMIWRIVFRNALRNSDVLQSKQRMTYTVVLYKKIYIYIY